MAIEEYMFALGDKRNFSPSGGFLYRNNQELIREIFDENNIIAVKRKNPVSSPASNNIVYVFNLNKIKADEDVEDLEK